MPIIDNNAYHERRLDTKTKIIIKEQKYADTVLTLYYCTKYKSVYLHDSQYNMMINSYGRRWHMANLRFQAGRREENLRADG
jgi:hypothetical protein